jgi:hypothetical protein
MAPVEIARRRWMGLVIPASLRAASLAASTLAMSIVPRKLYAVYSMGTHVQTGALPL